MPVIKAFLGIRYKLPFLDADLHGKSYFPICAGAQNENLLSKKHKSLDTDLHGKAKDIRRGFIG